MVNFLKGLVNFLGDFFSLIFNVIFSFFNFLLGVFQAIFYFIYKLFELLILIFRFFYYIFDYFFALFFSFFNFIKQFLVPTFSSVNLGTDFGRGFNLFVSFLEPIGFFTIVPVIFMFLVWFLFVYKILELFRK